MAGRSPDEPQRVAASCHPGDLPARRGHLVLFVCHSISRMDSNARLYSVTSLPWWATIVGWVLTLCGTLGGVFWTQFRADLREDKRVADERAARLLERRADLYRQLLTKASRLRALWSQPKDVADYNENRDALFEFDELTQLSHVLGSDLVATAASDFIGAVGELHHLKPEANEAQKTAARLVVQEALYELRTTIRKDFQVHPQTS
jgi:hypothetical protein